MSLPELRSYDVLVVGAGFSGVGAAIKLREAGISDFAVLEKGSAIGGTWRDNTYPGCACDVPSTLYSFSFALNPDWSRFFAQQAEIQAYLERVARDRGVLEHVHLETEVLEASWDADNQRWEVQTSAGPYVARTLIAGAGPLHEPRLPDIDGMDEFEGTVFHSARWDHSHDLRGRRVAVIGTGSSAIQFLPEIAPLPERLTLFQRTAPWVLPKPDRPVTTVERAMFRSVPGAQRAFREFLFGMHEVIGYIQRHEPLMERVQQPLRSYLKRAVKDPELRRICTPDFTLGCKRILLSNTWYPTLQRPNVDVVPHGVERLTATGIVGTDGVEREVDTVIFGTGFHVTDPPIGDRVRGVDGRTLSERWQGSPRAYLGTTVSGFPNLFLLIGPNTANGHSSAILLIEAQLTYAVDALRAMRSRGIASVDLRPEVEDAYNAQVQEALTDTVWNAGGCQSYYLDSTGRNTTIYPWSIVDLQRRTRRFDLERYATRSDVTTAASASST